ncbi:MAG: hypothetical protein HY919_00740 [Elusimicrobia bacterium]|nr:hypothetical protein [Elusimicrobiota bacterium]
MKKLILILIVVLVGLYFATDYFKKQSKISQKITQTIKTPTDKASEIVRTENLRILENAVKRYKYEKGKFPETLDEMVSSGYIDRIPEGNWEYDITTGEVR